ncbi:hypothetical protein VTJ04DRAFT_1762 [Mycothermus thermophilus]|uniref:uncharacterized protein n=1 Tax=Humicola insolens TaxID=85995 RepID=UPI00374217C7
MLDLITHSSSPRLLSMEARVLADRPALRLRSPPCPALPPRRINESRIETRKKNTTLIKNHDRRRAPRIPRERHAGI